MIPVIPQPEPADFDVKVRQKGWAHLQKYALDPDTVLPRGHKLPAYWRDCLDDLYISYNKICAYLAIYLERTTGDCSVDHFVAKSSLPGRAYDWDNYRLACRQMNTNKGQADDVLDPFEVKLDWFHLNLVTGGIFPNPRLDESTKARIQFTIDRLKLDSAENRNTRAMRFQEYFQYKLPPEFLLEKAPLLFFEARRQGLL